MIGGVDERVEPADQGRLASGSGAPPDLLPGAAPDDAPFSADGGRVGIVLSHGFTGTPASLRAWAEHFADAGYTVRLPLLPGHGTHWRETNKSRWPQWYAAVESAFDEVRRRCDTVFAFGLSMGGTLVTRLAEEHPDDIAGLVLVNPAYTTDRLDAKFAPYIAWAVRSRPSIGSDIKKAGVVEPADDRTPVVAFVSLQKLWKVTRADLAAVRAPILLFRSRKDHVVDPSSAQVLKSGAVNTTVREVILEDSYHVATMDNDAPTIFDGSLRFVEELTPVDGT
jgi:carboxylesterase